RNANCGTKVIHKITPNEPISVVCLCNSAFNVIEYSEINANVAHTINPKHLQLLAARDLILALFCIQTFLGLLAGLLLI
ncbi:hypothetical protein CPB97_006254, partial [Podila verticillata]